MPKVNGPVFYVSQSEYLEVIVIDGVLYAINRGKEPCTFTVNATLKPVAAQYT